MIDLVFIDNTALLIIWFLVGFAIFIIFYEIEQNNKKKNNSK